ncbi:GDSL-type esterase/lipase family protein [Piscinibacter sakaiensis]|uniref:GDSL-type esterase/lipase family protein n=1 Tax=Piscinibacter sakaiensis TaxID=1547922 RepID=UPI003AACD803
MGLKPQQLRGRARSWAIGLVLLLGTALLLLSVNQPAPPVAERLAWRQAFVAALHGPLDEAPPYDDRSLRFADLSLRQFVPLALPGNTVRLRLSNQFGDGPLRIAAAQLAWRAPVGGAAIRPGSARPLRFTGQPTVTLEPGRTVLSDPVELPAVAPDTDLAVSFYLNQPTPRASWHLVGSRSSYRSPPGNHIESTVLPQAEMSRSLFFIAGVEVLADEAAATWVGFGDSITDGNGHRLDADASWPGQVSQRWRQGRSGPPVGMLNAGMSGNRLLSAEVGPSGLQRFDRDVLALDGVRGVVILIGINDLAGTADAEDMPATVQRLIDGQTELARRARERGLKVVGATLTPAQGGVYGRVEVEAGRQQLNRWIRSAGVFDAVVDLDAALRDPAAPHRIRAELTRDGLHPDDEGYRVIGAAVVKTLADAGLQR